MQANQWTHWENSRAAMSEAELNRQQAIAAPAYFSRYFSYSVASGDVTDREFVAFIHSNSVDQLAMLRGFSQRIGVSAVLDRLTYRLPELLPEVSRTLLTSLITATELFPAPWNHDSAQIGELAQLARLFPQLLEKLPDQHERQQVAQEIVRAQGRYELAYQVNYQLRQHYRTEQRPGPYGEPNRLLPLFSKTGWEEYLAAAGRLLLERALLEAGDTPLYRSHPVYARQLLTEIWPQVDRPPGPQAYVFAWLAYNPDDLVEFLAACGPLASSGGQPYTQVGLGVHEFDRLRDMFGEPLYKLVRAQFGPEQVESVDFDTFDVPTSRQRLSQFIYLYEHRLAPSP